MMLAGARSGNGPSSYPFPRLIFDFSNQGYRLFLSSTHKAMPLAVLILAAALAASGEAAAQKAAANPFDLLSGDWKGGGTVRPADGHPKKVSCKVTYKVAGSNMSQHLRCAGTDYKINASLKLTYKGGKIKGSWSESTYDTNGRVTGTAKDNIIHARITGDKFSGRMSINVADAGHEINIVQFNESSGTYRLVGSLFLRR
jgi:hypothetical protein